MTSQSKNAKTPVWVIILAAGLGCITLIAVFLGAYFLLRSKNNVEREVVEELYSVPESVAEERFQYTIEDMYYLCSERHINSMDIKHFTKAELRIIRNQIYAKYGYKFKSKDLQEYFGQQHWYVPRYNDVSNRLTTIERDNVDFIQSYEK